MAALKATASARKRLTFEMFHPGKTNPGRYQNHVKHGINRCKKPCEEWDEKNKPCEEWDGLSILPTGGSIPSVHILGFIHVPGRHGNKSPLGLTVENSPALMVLAQKFRMRYSFKKNTIYLLGMNFQGCWDDLTQHHLRVPVGYHHSIIKAMCKNTQNGHAATHPQLLPSSQILDLSPV